MENKKKIPELRFHGFTEDWEDKKFEKVFRGIRNNSLSRDKLNYKYGQAKNIHYGDILVKFGEIVDAQKQQLPFITSDEDSESLSGSQLMNGDIVLADAAEDETVGKCIEIQNINTDLIHSGLHTIAVRPLQKFAPKYLGYYMNSNSYHDQLVRLMQGTKVLSISKSAIQDTDIRFPSNEEEQSKISEYITEIDQLITKHQKKNNRLVTLKKSMLEKMFPKEGQTAPEIRFKGFEGGWELMRLYEFTDKAVDNRGKTPPLSKVGNHPLIEVASLGHGFPDYTKISKYLDDFSFKNFLRAHIQEGDILFSTVGSVGLVSIMDNNLNAAIAQNIVAFRAKPGFAPEYLHSLFSNSHNKSLSVKIVMGAIQPSIKVSQLINVKYYVAKDEDEQKMIGNFFSKLNILISNHQQQIEKLKKFKQSLSEKMFV